MALKVTLDTLKKKLGLSSGKEKDRTRALT